MDLALLIEHLKDDESFVRHGYLDSRGYLTIGYGRLIDKKLGGGISEPEAAQLLLNDVTVTIAELDEKVPWWRNLPELDQRVIADMAFNLGVPKLMTFTQTLPAIRRGDRAAAAGFMRKTAWYSQTKRRARRLTIMIETGVDPGPQ